MHQECVAMHIQKNSEKESETNTPTTYTIRSMDTATPTIIGKDIKDTTARYPSQMVSLMEQPSQYHIQFLTESLPRDQTLFEIQQLTGGHLFEALILDDNLVIIVEMKVISQQAAGKGPESIAMSVFAAGTTRKCIIILRSMTDYSNVKVIVE